MEQVESFCSQICILKDGNLIVSDQLANVKSSYDYRYLELETAATHLKDYLTHRQYDFTQENNRYKLRIPRSEKSTSLFRNLVRNSSCRGFTKEPSLHEIFIERTGGMSLRNFSIVFSTVFKEAVKTKPYLYITIGLVALSVLLFASPAILNMFNKNGSEETYKIVNHTSLELSEQELAGVAGSWQIVNDVKIESLKEEIKEEELNGFFILEEQADMMQLNIYMPKVNNELLLTLESYIEQKKVESIVAAQSIDPAVVQALNAPLQSSVESLYETEPNALLIVYGLITIMF